MILNLLGILYGRIMGARNALYDRGALKSHTLGAKTISVGNLTTGGTGKTPLVALIAEILAEKGEKVCILTRGYGRTNPRSRVLVSDGEKVLVDAETGGDEPVELARKLIGKAVVVVDADRISAAAWAKGKFGITAFILDDGFQHRRAKRDLDIVCVDATNPCGNGRLLPAGPMRESIRGVERADAIVITRSDLVADSDDLEARLRKMNGSARIFKASGKISELVDLQEFPAKSRKTQSEDKAAWEKVWEREFRLPHDEIKLSAFCALGNTDAFFNQLNGILDTDQLAEKFDLAAIKKFPDHHRYRQSDIDDLENQAGECGVDMFVTTAKDAVKLERLKFSLPCYVAIAETVIDDPAAFRDLLLSV